ncbi:MAG: hypothetical protein HY390_00220 [Deltaproteobacteria bacterium]|nr:hypothetical protein [Deltaproteobacteria bacterium]
MKVDKYWLLIGMVVLLALVAIGYGGFHLIAQEGLQGLFTREVMGVDLNQKTMAHISIFLIMPFGLGGILMAIYQFSADLAVKLLNVAALLVSILGSTINYFLTLTIAFLF